MKVGTKCIRYSEQELEFLKQNYGTMDSATIASRLNRTKQSVLVMASKIKVSTPPPSDLLPGTRFNRLIVIKKTNKKDNSRGFIYECMCDCGTTKEFSRKSLVSKHSQSCGCYQRDRLRETNTSPPGEATISQKFFCCRYGAQERDIDFNLTKEEHAKIISGDCDYCGEKPQRSNYLIKKDGNVKKVSHKVSKENIENSWTYTNTVDRIDSDKGYLLENCVPSCWPCNQMKNDSTAEDFIAQAYKIVAFQEKKKAVK